MVAFEKLKKICRGRSRAAATSKMECFVIIINSWKPLTIIAKHSILDTAAALDPPLICKGKEVVKSNPLVLITFERTYMGNSIA